MKFGLSDAEYLFLEENLIIPLKKMGAQVFLFGSRATGKHQKFSDIDLLFHNPTASVSSSEVYSLLSRMEDSTFPYKIDLVNESELAKSYRARVDREKVEL